MSSRFLRIALAAVSLSLLAGCVQNRTLGEGIDDVGADLNIKQRLLRDRTIDASDVDVSVFEGRVLLAGTVPSEEHRARLVQKARGVPSVREVIDEVRIGGQTKPAQGARDAVIDTKLGTAMKADNGVYRENYQIVVSQGTVYLLGVAQGPNELDRVVGRARSVEGARDVVSHVVFVGDPRRSVQR